jgi:hypothetical protein
MSASAAGVRVVKSRVFLRSRPRFRIFEVVVVVFVPRCRLHLR